MNKIKKIGLSALAGSLAMVSANAIEYSISGGMIATYTTADSVSAAATAESQSGKGIGTATDLVFTASTELDNGFTVGYLMGVDTNAALSNTSSQMTIGMGSLGTLQLNNIAGAKANGIDDVMPAAYNETWDGLSTGVVGDNPSFFGRSTASGSVDYRIPAQELMGVTVNASVTYDPQAGLGAASKGGVVATNPGSGTAYTLQLAHESGLEIGGGIEEVDTLVSAAGAAGVNTSTAYVKYAMGGITIAYQESYLDAGHRNPPAGETLLGYDRDQESEMLGIAYTGGDVTVSYGESQVKHKGVGVTAALAEIELTSVQAAYTMGAMTISAAMSETDNSAGILNDKYSENTLAVSFAF